MRSEAVEIYSDASNAAVMRVPGRKFPGVLVQGDTLHILCAAVDEVLKAPSSNDAIAELEMVRVRLNGLRMLYEETLRAHDMPLPY